MTHRITHLDTARGAAVLGILIMNSVSMGLGNLAYVDLSAGGSHTPLDWALGVAGEILADQKFMGLFSLLFGASVLLFLDRVRDRTQRPVGLSLWRNALLFGLGSLHGLVWEGDILTVYALCAPVLLLLRNAPARVLVGGGLLVYSLSPLSLGLCAPLLSDAALVPVLTDLDWTDQDNLAVGVALGQFLLDVFSRALGMMLLGMGLYRSGWLARPKTPRDRKVAGAAVAVGACLSAAGVAWVAAEGFGARAAIVGGLPNTLATPAMALGYFVFLQHADTRLQGRWLHRVRALGRTALTNYLAQTVVFVSLLAAVPASWVSRSTLWLAMAALWVLQLWASEVWLRTFSMGPLEWAWRCATYRRVEPLLR